LKAGPAVCQLNLNITTQKKLAIAIETSLNCSPQRSNGGDGCHAKN
jgi:hypothetical protein